MATYYNATGMILRPRIIVALHAGLGRLSNKHAMSPAFDALTVAAYIRACGCSADFKLQKRSQDVDERWVVCA